jgi:hypothetical protein
MFKVYRYSFYLNRDVLVSQHRFLKNAVAKARQLYIDGSSEVHILDKNHKKLDRYGKEVENVNV